ncbi:hypothetical protein D9758_018198 [Tetrapyrgos nigripes]|uniref:NADP-dependent oxidoreductase domain-containing protein n=1 Tax=Tetrapyrgos nigripes TaxID=182062 RepID=A0A8H5FA88_9AGAR|nr:hypothetical protein D9758_018198 [Tetrapyrgos nigripes]
MVYIPTIAFGTGSKWKWHDVTTYVQLALESGFSHLDTAAFYETEPFVGRAINESGLSRKDLFLTTKCGLMIPLRNSLKDSLEKLGVEYVDLFLIYNHFFVPDIKEAWKEMEKLKEEGLTRSIGVSNYEVKHLRDTLKVAKVKPAVNQISLNPYNYAEMRPIIDYCQENGIVVEAPITTYPGGPVDIPITAAALRLGITPTQVIFLWVRAKGAVIVTTTSSKERMKEYLAVNDLPPTSLTHEEIAAIDHAGANGPPPGPVHLVPVVAVVVVVPPLPPLADFVVVVFVVVPVPFQRRRCGFGRRKITISNDTDNDNANNKNNTNAPSSSPTKLILVGVIIILLLSITFILGIVLVLMGLLC